MRKRAFTLAEVLITLGIIGVVAALVMPSLMANYQKKVWVAQLQKSLNTWQNGLKLMMATDGVDNFSDTEFFKAVTNAGMGCYEIASDTPEAANILKKYFNMAKLVDEESAKLNPLSGEDSEDYYAVNFYMTDGSAGHFTFCKPSGLSALLPGGLLIDVNGKKGPSTQGRDIFSFAIDDKGNIIPQSSRQYADLKGADFWYWKNDSVACGIPGSSDVSGVSGYGCAARIIDNGWVMDY